VPPSKSIHVTCAPTPTYTHTHKQHQAAHVFLDVAKTCNSYQPTNLVPIGEATGALLTKAGGQIAYTPNKALAKVLAVELPPVEGKAGPTRVLYPASKKAQKTLEEGLAARVGLDGKPLFEVVRLNTYDTVPAEWGEAETVSLPVGPACACI
jgi:uroporphyrinogen-III synthase